MLSMTQFYIQTARTNSTHFHIYTTCVRVIYHIVRNVAGIKFGELPLILVKLLLTYIPGTGLFGYVAIKFYWRIFKLVV